MPALLDSKPMSLRNTKKLFLTLPSAHSSNNSLPEPHTALSLAPPHRRSSIMSLPATANALVHRREDADNAVPYSHGPVQIIPGIWLGSEDNARDWQGLIERGIKSILNVAKEVSCPLDPGHSLRPVSSTPDFKKQPKPDSTYYPPNIATGRPGMHYLKLQWSHGQQDLVHIGFNDAMAFTDAALARAEGVLIHCQCGISRSATMVIALVMRAAAEQSPSVPPDVWALKGMQGAYSYVKEKSKWVGPNMSLIYQLMDYEKKLKRDSGSPSDSEKSSFIDEEEEWGRQRRLLDDMPSDDEPENTFVKREAEALDKAMEERVVARQSSASSLASSSNSRVGMGVAWRTRYANQRKRTGSIASNATGASSRLSENLVEEDEEEDLLGVGGGFVSAEPSDSSASPDDDEEEATPLRVSTFTARPNPLLTAPVWKTSFNLAPPPATAFKPTFTLPPPPTATRSTFIIPPPPPTNGPHSIPPPRSKRRPAPIGILPPVPSSPIAIVVEPTPSSETPRQPNHPNSDIPPRTPALSLPPVRMRTTSGILPPPLHLRNHILRDTTAPVPGPSAQSQTLFVFPPSPTTLTSRTPSTMTLTSNTRGNGPVPFPSLSTPRVSTFRSQGRTRSFIGLAAPPAPTTGFSKVDARGYVGLE